jgi:hypothetical protein
MRRASVRRGRDAWAVVDALNALLLGSSLAPLAGMVGVLVYAAWSRGGAGEREAVESVDGG